MRKEFEFKERLASLAKSMLQKIRDKEEGKDLVFVGIHARRGDRIQKWRHRKIGTDSLVGTYEGMFFNYAMDMLRKRHNHNNTKVVFLPTSDNYFWIKQNLNSQNDIYFSRELIKQTRVALPNKKEIRQIWNHQSLAVKGKQMIYLGIL